jgi:hypothetical protein
MLYLYDAAIAKDIKSSFTDEVGNSEVKVVDPQAAVNILSQIQDDNLKFPAVVLTRDPTYSIDNQRTNFTAMHRGVLTVMDNSTNELYYEKSIPIRLKYNLTVLATNTADADELTKELLFKYLQMYYLSIRLPYEADRIIRFGISITTESDIQQSSGSFDYLEAGKLYQTIIPLVCEGCVLVSYTPCRLKHVGIEYVVPVQHEYLEQNTSKF